MYCPHSHDVVVNDSGRCKAGFLGDDAARACSVSVGHNSGTCNAGFAGDDVPLALLLSTVDRSNTLALHFF